MAEQEQTGVVSWLPRVDARVVDALLALGLTVASLTTYFLSTPVAGFHRKDTLGAVLAALNTAPIALLRVFPLGAFGVLGTSVIVQSVLGYPLLGWSAAATCIALFLLTIVASYRAGVAAAVLSGVVLVVLFIFSHTIAGWGTRVFLWLAFSGAYLLGLVIKVYRESAAQAAQRAALFAADREARAIEAVAEERARLARELHDVVGHALNVVVIQAGAAQRVMEKKPQLAREALASIETAGRQALQDVERMLGILRAESDEGESLQARPGLGRIEALAEQVEHAGLPVHVVVTGRRITLPASLDMSAYRIVQEALTNSLKHAGRAHATVILSYSDDALEVEVLDDGCGVHVDGEEALAGGRGIPGMRERVAVFGGHMEVGRRQERGFRVWARLPLTGAVGGADAVLLSDAAREKPTAASD
jgi:signal transduction histidine kinase